MISYIDTYNDLVEKKCIMKNKKREEKQRNGLLNPSLKFSSSLNAFIPPDDDDSPKMNKTDFINVVKNSFETLGKQPPSDVEIEEAFMNLSELDIEAFNREADRMIQIFNDASAINENSLSSAQIYNIGRQISRTLALTFPDLFENGERSVENDSVSDWDGSSSSGSSYISPVEDVPFGSPSILPTPRTAPTMPTRNVNFSNEYPPIGQEAIYGFVEGTRNTKAQLAELEIERRKKETNDGRKFNLGATLTGERGRPISFELEPAPNSTNLFQPST